MPRDTTPSDDPEKPDLPGLKLLHRIGFGSSGEVWSCRNEVGRSVSAVKIVRRTTQNQRVWYKHELKALKKFMSIRRRPDSLLSINHVAKSSDKSFLYYTMPMADSVGGFPQGSAKYRALTLGKRLKHDGRLDLREAAEIAVRIVEALRTLHANKLLHRDVKPDNILFIDGQAVLADIGLVTDDRAGASRAGTEKYMEPGKDPSKSTDLYALGKVLYRMVNGLDPVDDFPDCASLGDGEDKALFRALNDICMRACGDKEERYDNAEQMLCELRKALDAHPDVGPEHFTEHNENEKGEEPPVNQPLPERTLVSEGYTLRRKIGEGERWRVWIADVPGGGTGALKIEEFLDGDRAGMDRRWDVIDQIRKLAANCDCLAGIDRMERHHDCGFIAYATQYPEDADGCQSLNLETYVPRTIEHEIDRYGRLSVADCVAIGKRVLAGLQALHETGTPHGDVNTTTVAYVGGRSVLSCIAFPIPEKGAPTTATDELQAPPEKVRTPLGDLYLVADLLCRMATGRRLKDASETGINIPDPAFPRLLRVFRVAGDGNPLARYVSARVMSLALDWVLWEDGCPRKKSQVSASEIVKRLFSPRQPEPTEMTWFKSRISSTINTAKTESSGRGGCGVLTREDFSGIANQVCLVFERRMGFEPPIVRSACLLAETVMVREQGELKKLLKQASAIGGGATGIGMVVGGIGMSLGWGGGLLHAVIVLFLGGPVFWPIALIVAGMTVGGVVTLRYFRKETPSATADRAVKALGDGVNRAIDELWAEYGDQLSV